MVSYFLLAVNLLQYVLLSESEKLIAEHCLLTENLEQNILNLLKPYCSIIPPTNLSGTGGKCLNPSIEYGPSIPLLAAANLLVVSSPLWLFPSALVGIQLP
jgi:hypothetical protein